MALRRRLADRADVDLRYRGEAPPLNATYRLGFAGEGRTDIRNLTANLSSTGSFNPRPWLNAKTTLGAQYVNYSFSQNAGEGSNLPPGTQTPGAGAEPNAASATTLQMPASVSSWSMSPNSRPSRPIGNWRFCIAVTSS